MRDIVFIGYAPTVLQVEDQIEERSVRISVASNYPSRCSIGASSKLIYSQRGTVYVLNDSQNIINLKNEQHIFLARLTVSLLMVSIKQAIRF
jgi:environmental stress-induced protein Ves